MDVEAGTDGDEGGEDGEDGRDVADGEETVEETGKNCAGFKRSIETVTLFPFRCRSNVFSERSRTKKGPS